MFGAHIQIRIHGKTCTRLACNYENTVRGGLTTEWYPKWGGSEIILCNDVSTIF